MCVGSFKRACDGCNEAKWLYQQLCFEAIFPAAENRHSDDDDDDNLIIMMIVYVCMSVCLYVPYLLHNEGANLDKICMNIVAHTTINNAEVINQTLQDFSFDFKKSWYAFSLFPVICTWARSIDNKGCCLLFFSNVAAFCMLTGEKYLNKNITEL